MNLWVVPAIEIAIAIVLFAGTYTADRAVYDAQQTLPSWVIGGTADSARQIQGRLLNSPATQIRRESSRESRYTTTRDLTDDCGREVGREALRQRILAPVVHKSDTEMAGFTGIIGTRKRLENALQTPLPSHISHERARGAYRNRTGVNGFAGRCVATPPRRRETT